MATFAVLSAVTIAAYLPVFRAGFIWDDDGYVTRPALRTLSGLRRIWLQVGATEQYYPLLHSLFWVEHRLWGDAPGPYHLVNVLLHAGSASMLVLLLRRLGVPGAWLAGLLFAVHPVCVESVAWVSEAKNTVSTFFYLAAGLAYLRWRQGPRPTGVYVLATACFLLALLSKSVAASLPGVLLVLAWWEHGTLTWKEDVRPLLPWFVLGASAGLFTGWVERRYIGAEGPAFQIGLAGRCIFAGRAAWFYLGKLLWPARLAFIYPRWRIDPLAAWQYSFLVAALAVLFVFWRIRRRSRAPLAVALLFVGVLFPTLGFFNVFAFIYSYVADHWNYLGALVILSAIAAAAAAVARMLRVPPWIRYGVALAILVCLAGRTREEAALYRSPATFYTTLLRRNPGCWLAEENLGVLLAREGNLPAAVSHYERAIRLNPGLPQAYTNYGNALAREGRWPAAFAAYADALRVAPAYGEADDNWGMALLDAGQFSNAALRFESALRLNPNDALAEYGLGNTLARSGQLEAAEAHYRRAIELRPDDAEAYFDLGNVFLRRGALSAAVAAYEADLRLEPHNGAAHRNLGYTLHYLGREAEARDEFQAAAANGVRP